MCFGLSFGGFPWGSIWGSTKAPLLHGVPGCPLGDPVGDPLNFLQPARWLARINGTEAYPWGYARSILVVSWVVCILSCTLVVLAAYCGVSWWVPRNVSMVGHWGRNLGDYTGGYLEVALCRIVRVILDGVWAVSWSVGMVSWIVHRVVCDVNDALRRRLAIDDMAIFAYSQAAQHRRWLP